MKSVSVTAATWQAVSSEPLCGDEETRRAEEEAWIVRSKAGDMDAFALIYHRYEESVYRYAFRLLENADEADDIRQETFVRAFKALPRFRGQSRLRTYLFAICGNLCRDRLRYHHRHPEKAYGLAAPEGAVHLTRALIDGQNDPMIGLVRVADAERVHRTLLRLSASDREILLLRHVENLELDEIAIILSCTRVSVPVRLFRARKRFKDIYLSLLKEEGE